MAVNGGSVGVDVHPIPNSPSVSFPAPSISGDRFVQEYKTDDPDELIQGVHIPHKIALGAFPDGELMQGDWWFGMPVRADQLIGRGDRDSSAPVMKGRSVMAWNEFYSKPENQFPTEAGAWKAGIEQRFIGVLKATRVGDSYHSFTVGRRAFNVLNYWSPTRDKDPVTTSDHLWFHLIAEQDATTAKWRLRFEPYCEPYGVPEDKVVVQRWRVARVQHADPLSFQTPMKEGPPLTQSKRAENLKPEGQVQMHRGLLNQNPRIPIVLVGGRYWA